MDTKTNIRYVLVYRHKDGNWYLMTPGQGIYTHATRTKAERLLRAMKEANSSETMFQLFGDEQAVVPVECYPKYNDPKITVFGDKYVEENCR